LDKDASGISRLGLKVSREFVPLRLRELKWFPLTAAAHSGIVDSLREKIVHHMKRREDLCGEQVRDLPQQIGNSPVLGKLTAHTA
jgi:hypothetical protein